MYVGSLNLLEVVMQHFSHGATRDVCALLGQTTIGKVSSRMLAVGHVHVGDDVDDAAVGLLGQTLVLTTVAGLHVEDGDVQTLGADDTQAAVGVAQDEDGIGLDLHHQLVALGDDVAHGLAQIVADGIHVNLGIGELQVLEEHAVEVIVVVLARMRQYGVEVLTTFVDDGCQANNLRARADDDQQL